MSALRDIEYAVLNKNIATIRPRFRIGWIMFTALLLSLLLHLVLFVAPQLHLVLFPENEPTGIEADLVSVLKVQIATPAPVVPAPPVAPKPKQLSQVAGPTLAAPVTPKPVTPEPESTIPDVPETLDETVSPEAVSDDFKTTEEAVPASDVIAPATDPVVPVADESTRVEAPESVAETQPMPPEEAVAEPHPPLKLVVNYSLLKGKDGMKVGRVVHTWDIDDGHYVIASVIEPAGLAKLFTSEVMVQSSRGRITASGLEPDVYWEQRGQKEDRTFNAEFDYLNNTLTYGRVTERTTVALLPGTQDQLSFIYQFGLKAPLSGTVDFSMTSGRKVGSYSCEVVGEEMIKSGMGELRTLHLRKILKEPTDDGVEVWLALDHQYLPVKVRVTNNKGDVLEQVVNGIQKE